MTKRIKRITALMTAGILLIGISFASTAEETSDLFTETEEPVAEAVIEEPATAEEPAAEEPAAEEPAVEEPAAEETAEEEASIPEAQAEPEENNTPAATANETSEDYGVIIDDEGFVDPELVETYFPNGTGPELETAAGTEATEESETTEKATENEETETENNETEAITEGNRIWIATEDDKEIYIGETTTLIAKAEKELVGVITWEVRDERWEEDVWQTIGEGEKLNLDVTEAIAELLVRFTLSDGTVSEIFELSAIEKPEEENTEETEEQTEVLNKKDGEDVENTEADEQGSENEETLTEETTEGTTDEETETEETITAVIVTRAWITAEIPANEDAGEAAEAEAADETKATEEAEAAGETEAAEETTKAVTLTANADPEMIGINIWETRNVNEETWTRIGYGDQIAVEITEENNGIVYRFVMENGFVSEEYALTVETEEAEDETAETEETLPEEAEETKEIELPEDRKVDVVISWEDPIPGIGSTAHLDAVLTGYEELEYTLQWVTSTDNENWEEIEGATGSRMDVVVTEENYENYWRVRVHVEGYKTEPEPAKNTDE